ncbi:MAG: nucleotidyltransferase domain-containing protein [Actinomycetota bacterium]|nr:nucleotidyltransferase domain-containing protein [Actinomycetota bacterium]
MSDVRDVEPTSLRPIIESQPYPVVFATVSGAHLYGFASRDSDIDLRGVHLLPAREVVGLRTGPQTLDRSWVHEGVEMDLVTHDLAKFARLLMRRNGYVLEQLLSPLVVTTSPAHAELVAAAPACLTRHHAHHYLGFARTQYELFGRTGELKPLLYTVRVLLTGIHLMRTGQVQAHLPSLSAAVPETPDWVGDAMQHKAYAEHTVNDGLVPAQQVDADYLRLVAVLEDERDRSSLPEAPTAEPALHDLVVRQRLSSA